MNGGQMISNGRSYEVVIQRRIEPVADVDGFEGDEQWENYYTNFAYCNSLNGAERWQAAQVESDKVIRFTFRWHPQLNDVKPKYYRLLFMGKPYTITYVDDIQYKHETVKIDALEVEA